MASLSSSLSPKKGTLAGRGGQWVPGFTEELMAPIPGQGGQLLASGRGRRAPASLLAPSVLLTVDPTHQEEMDSGSPSASPCESQNHPHLSTRSSPPPAAFTSNSFLSPLLSFCSQFLALLWQETLLITVICRGVAVCRWTRGPCPSVSLELV